MESSQPGSSQHSLPAKQEPPRVGEETPKAPKALPRVEDGGLDSVAPRTVPEHVAIAKTEPVVTTVSRTVAPPSGYTDGLRPCSGSVCLLSFPRSPNPPAWCSP